MTQLFQIEQAIAARCGPFFQGSVQVVASGSYNTLVCRDLTSSLDLGDQWAGKYLLRRNQYFYPQNYHLITYGTAPLPRGSGVVNPYTVGVVPFSPDQDRVRRVLSYDPSTGTITVDLPWQVSPATGEAFELHTLHPTAELTRSAMAGLRRCFTIDRVSVPTTGIATERDLTALVPWLTDPKQIYDVHYVLPGTVYLPTPVQWFNPYLSGGHVWLQATPDPYPNNLLITCRRPVTSLSTPADPPARVVGWTLKQAYVPGGGTLILCDVPGHPFKTGDSVTVHVNETLNTPSLFYGSFTITVIDVETFTLDNSYLGMIAPQSEVTGTVFSSAGSTSSTRSIVAGDARQSPISLTIPNHPYFTGRVLDLTFPNDPAIAAILSTHPWQITVMDANTITLDGSVETHGGTYMGSAGSFELFPQDPSPAAWSFLGTAALDATQVALYDTDDVQVDLDYATAFGVVSAWQVAPYKLMPAAQAGTILTLEMASAEATRQAYAHFNPPERRWQLGAPFPSWQGLRL